MKHRAFFGGRDPGRAHRADGFSVFGASRSQFDRFLKSCRGDGCQAIIASRAARRSLILSGQPPMVVIFQDLPPRSIAPLVERIIFPAWFRQIPICLFSVSGRSDYLEKRVTSSDLHRDVDAVVAFLLGEQMIALLEKASCGDGTGIPASSSASPEPGPEVSCPDPITLDRDLDASQRAAAGHASGPMRVLAPAGSGKTKTLINRICNLVNGGVDPERIFPLAFNKRAETEMNQRLRARGLQTVRARTIHSLGYEVVRSGLHRDFDADHETMKTRELLTEALRVFDDFTAERTGDCLDRCLEKLHEARMELPPIDGLTIEVKGRSLPFAPVFRRFLELGEERHCMDFEDMVYLALRVLVDDDRLRRKYQHACQYLLVDEYQDLNRAQILLLEILALPENNLFIVGDDDQMIYGWRGAETRHIIDFPARYPQARTCTLSTNYRSCRNIVVHSRWLIDHNRNRVPKVIGPRLGAPPGSFALELAGGLWEQAEAAAAWILAARKAGGRRWSEFGVLFRYNAQAFIVALAMDRRDIPHTGIAGSHLFDSRVGRDICAYLRVIIDPAGAAPEDVMRILKRQGIRPGVLQRANSLKDLVAPGSPPGLTQDEETEIRELVEKLDILHSRASEAGATAAGLVEDLCSLMHLRESYRARAIRRADPDEADDLTCLDVIGSVAVGFQRPAGFLAHAEAAMREAVTPLETEREERDEVTLSTIHRAKGNEFTAAVCFDLSLRRRLRPEEIEEERRVAYVALTRAKESLLITADRRKQSPFLHEATLNPHFVRRSREDLESGLRSLRRRMQRCDRRTKGPPCAEPARSSPEEQRDYHRAPGTNSDRTFAIPAWFRRLRCSLAVQRPECNPQRARLIHAGLSDVLKEEVLSLEEELYYRRVLDVG